MWPKVLAPMLGVAAIVAVWFYWSEGPPPPQDAPQEQLRQPEQPAHSSQPRIGSADAPQKAVAARGGAMSERLRAMREARATRRDPGVREDADVQPQAEASDDDTADINIQGNTEREPKGGFERRNMPERSRPQGPIGPRPAAAPLDPQDDQDLKTIRDALASGEAQDRVEAVESLDLFDDQVALPILSEALADPDADVRRAALDEIGLLVDEPPLDVLAKAMNDDDPEIRAAALEMLGESNDEGRWPIIEGARNDQDDDIRSDAEDMVQERIEDESPE